MGICEPSLCLGVVFHQPCLVWMEKGVCCNRQSCKVSSRLSQLLSCTAMAFCTAVSDAVSRLNQLLGSSHNGLIQLVYGLICRIWIIYGCTKIHLPKVYSVQNTVLKQHLNLGFFLFYLLVYIFSELPNEKHLMCF